MSEDAENSRVKRLLDAEMAMESIRLEALKVLTYGSNTPPASPRSAELSEPRRAGSSERRSLKTRSSTIDDRQLARH